MNRAPVTTRWRAFGVGGILTWPAAFTPMSRTNARHNDEERRIMKTKLNPDGRYLTKDGSVQVPMHPLWVLARYPFRNITDLWSLRNPLRWYRYGNWRYFVRTLPGEHATPGELAAFDQRAAEIRELGVLRFGRKPRHEGGPDAG